MPKQSEPREQAQTAKPLVDQRRAARELHCESQGRPLPQPLDGVPCSLWRSQVGPTNVGFSYEGPHCAFTEHSRSPATSETYHGAGPRALNSPRSSGGPFVSLQTL